MKKIIALLASASLLGISATVFAQEEQAAKPEKVNLSLTFCKRDKETGERKAIWPFAEPSRKEIGTTQAAAAGVNEELVCTMSEKKGGYQVKFFSVKGVWREKELGLGMCGKDSYIEFPAIEGLRIVSISLVEPNENPIGSPRVVKVDGSEYKAGGDPIIEEKETKDGEKYIKYTYKLKGSALGAGSRIIITGDEEFRAQRINVAYRAPKPKAE